MSPIQPIQPTGLMTPISPILPIGFSPIGSVQSNRPIPI